MRIRIKEKGFFGNRRINSVAKIDSVIVRENILEPAKEKVVVLFKGNCSSGILEISRMEFESLMRNAKPVSAIVTKMPSIELEKTEKKMETKKKKSVKKRR